MKTDVKGQWNPEQSQMYGRGGNHPRKANEDGSRRDGGCTSTTDATAIFASGCREERRLSGCQYKREHG